MIASVPIPVVDLNDVFICKEQSTPPTPSVLPLQRLGESSSEERMCFQSLAPVEQLSVVRACFTSDFDMSSDRRVAVLPKSCALWGSEYPMAVSLRSPVFPPYPLTSLSWVSKS
jgi:hypothetical protein